MDNSREIFTQEIMQHADLYGNKTANLQALDSSFPGHVPAFFPFSDAFIKAYLDEHAPEWRALWDRFQTEQRAHHAEISSDASMILDTLRQIIIKTFAEHTIETPDLNSFLTSMHNNNETLMIRSTGEEDTAEVANPGGNESIAAVEPTPSAVSAAIGRVIASYFSEKSLKQRLLSSHSDITTSAFMPVLLQQMIGEPLNGFRSSPAVIRSGVMYTGNQGVQIQVAPGHGELVVNNKGAFDTFSVTREHVVYPEIARKTCRLVPGKDGLILKKNPMMLQNYPSISEQVVQRLAKLGRDIDEQYGMPMDIEYIYDPKKDRIYLVQARPIPMGDIKTITPSSVPPEKIPLLRQLIKEKTLQTKSTYVVTGAGFAAKVISNPNQLLVCDTINDALAHYLKQTHSPVKAVLVKEMAAASSHEAAQFNSKAIPVMQCDDLSDIRERLTTTGAVLMIDPQRNQLLDFTQFLETPEDAEQALRDRGFIADGLFTYPIKPMTAKPLPVAAKPFGLLFSKLTPQPIDHSHIYSQLLTNIEELEAVRSAEPNDAALNALKHIRYALYRLAKATQGQMTFFQQAMVSCEEIEQSILRTSSLSPTDTTRQALHEEHLHLISRLRSFVASSGHRQVFSNSIAQLFQEKKFREHVEEKLQGLDQEQTEYAIQFLKLTKIALNEPSKEGWVNLVLHCVQSKARLQQLAKIVLFYTDNQLESDFINITLPYMMQRNPSLEFILDQLYQNGSQIEKTLIKEGFHETQRTIDSWMQRIPEWSDPKKFDGLWDKYKHEVIPLIDKLNFIKDVDTDKEFWFTNGDDATLEQMINDVTSSSNMHLFASKYEDWYLIVPTEPHCMKISDPDSIQSLVKVVLAGYGDSWFEDVEFPIKKSLKRNKNASFIVNQIENIQINGYKNTIPATLANLTSHALFELIDLMDKTIKSLKGSPDYAENPHLLMRFYTLLQPYHALMNKWVKTIPFRLFESWYWHVNEGDRSCKYMLDKIQTVLETRLQEIEQYQYNYIVFCKNQLKPSNSISIPAVTIGSGVNFDRQFVNKMSMVTLEDLFSLIHQNTLTAVRACSKIILEACHMQSSFNMLPTDLQSLVQAFSTLSCVYPYKLLSITHTYPIVTILFNQPMRNHGAQYDIKFNQLTQQVILKGLISGENWNARMIKAEGLINYSARLLAIDIKQKPVYSNHSLSLDFTWEFPSNQLESLAKSMASVFSIIADMLDNRSDEYSPTRNFTDEIHALFIDRTEQTPKTAHHAVIEAKQALVELNKSAIPPEETSGMKKGR